jgi:hypothetical protein
VAETDQILCSSLTKSKKKQKKTTWDCISRGAVKTKSQLQKEPTVLAEVIHSQISTEYSFSLLLALQSCP